MHVHPTSLAEIMDQDSVVAFYEDFARLAFGDAKGTINTRYKLLKYQTKDEVKRASAAAALGVFAAGKRKRGEGCSGQIAAPGIDDIGEDGKIECSCCWTVKRDLFDLPMMIVMNVSSTRTRRRTANTHSSCRVYKYGTRKRIGFLDKVCSG